MTDTEYLRHVVLNSQKIRDFQVFGERRSGTNYLSALLSKNLAITEVTHYGWKHGVPSMPAISPNSLIVLITRNPMEWAKSFYVNPFDSTDAFRGNLSFEDFVEMEWASTALPSAQGWEKWGHQKIPNTRGQSLLWDHHPMTGKKYRDIFEMRSVKHTAWLGLEHRAENFVQVRLEDLQSDAKAVLEQLAAVFELSAVAKFNPVSARLGPPNMFPETVRKKPTAISTETRNKIKDAVDWGIENKIGYFEETLLTE